MTFVGDDDDNDNNDDDDDNNDENYDINDDDVEVENCRWSISCPSWFLLLWSETVIAASRAFSSLFSSS